MGGPERAEFDRSFAKASRPVTRWLALRASLTGIAVGLAGGACAAALAWKLRHGELRIASIVAFALAGAGVSFLVWRRRALTDREMALYLDRRLESHEVISTALEIDAGDPAAPIVVPQATEALDKARAETLRPRIFAKLQLVAPVALAAAIVFAVLPVPPAPPEPLPPPGSDVVQMDQVTDLDRMIDEIEKTKGRDPEQQKRLAELADRAKKLREKLEHGAPRRDVQSELSELSEGLAAERMDLGGGEKGQRGIEAALGKMNQPELKDARRALADRDMPKLDEEMDKLARQAEKQSRDRAKQALDEAAEAAKKEGAEDVAKALEEQKKRFEQTEKEAEKVRELAKALDEKLSEEQKAEQRRADSEGDKQAEDKVREAVQKALQNMSEADRKKLAEELAKQAKEGKGPDGKPLSDAEKKALEELAKQMATEQGMKDLQKALEQMANDKAPSSEAERQEQLSKAEKSLADAKKAINATETPPPGASSSGEPGGGSGSSSTPKKTPQTPTPKLSGSALRAHASANKLNPGAPLPGGTVGRTGARSGETANVKGTGVLGTVGPDEIGGVSRSDVPEEYREQVGRYFEP